MRPVLLLLLLALAAGCASTPEREAPSPRAGSEWARVRTDLALRNAADAIRTGDLDGARRELEATLDRGTTDARLHVLLAKIAIEQDRLRATALHLDLAEKLDPNLPSVALVRGLLAEVQGRWGAAASAYTKAAERFPEDERIQLARLRALQAAGLDDAADALLTRELASPRSSPEMLTAHGRRDLAAGRARSALTWFDRALAQRPEHASALDGRALALHALGRHEEVVAALRGRVGEGDHGSLQLALARSALVVGSYDLSIHMLQAHLGKQPRDPDAWLDLARAFFLTDRTRETGEALDEALAARPEFGPALVLRGHVAYRAQRWQEAAAAYAHAAALPDGGDRAQLHRLIAAAQGRAAAVAQRRAPAPVYRAPARPQPRPAARTPLPPTIPTRIPAAQPAAVPAGRLPPVHGIAWAPPGRSAR